MSLITCHKLCKTFVQGESQIKGLDNVSLRVELGEFVCLSGPSGSGKTTLLNTLGGLDIPDSGEVSIAEQKLAGLSRGELAEFRLHKLGFVFQAFNLIPVLTARENVEFIMQVQGVAAKQRREKALEVLAAVSLQGMENRLPSQLSGGQQQRVAVARAIASSPELVLADEPTANLDSHTADQLISLFEELNQSRAVTFVIASHDPRVMARAKRTITLQDGKIIDDQQAS